MPLALRQFVDMIGGDPNARSTSSGSSRSRRPRLLRRARSPGCASSCSSARSLLIISWTALWDKILSDGIGAHWGIYRGLLGHPRDRAARRRAVCVAKQPGGDEVAGTPTAPAGDLGLWKASELLTGAGIAAVIGCGLGITALGNLNPLGTGTPPIETTNLWDILLLVVSLGLVGIGSQIGTQGAGLRRRIGLLLFLVIAGLDLNSTPPHPFKLGVWPWVLLMLGLIGIGLSSVKEASLGDQPRRLVETLRGK